MRHFKTWVLMLPVQISDIIRHSLFWKLKRNSFTT